MSATISCFVTKNEQVLTDSAGVDKNQCLEYKFDLECRILTYVNFVPDQGSLLPSWMQHLWMYDRVAQDYFDQLVGTPEKLIEFAKKGQLSEASLTTLLERRIRKMFISVCEILEKSADLTLSEREECFKTCVDIWVDKFRYPENRIEVWRK